MVTLETAKQFMRVDGSDEDNLITSFISTATLLVEEILRKPLSEFEVVPEVVNQAILLLVSTLHEEQQVGKDGINLHEMLDLVRQMLFAYRKESF